jgi:hypothetical protein
LTRFFLAVALCSVLTCVGFAQTADAPASKEDVERYFHAIHSHEMMQQMIEAMSKPMHKMVHEQFEKDKDKLPADFEARMNKIMDHMMQGMPIDEMMDAMVPTYQNHLTKGDVDSLIAFYSTQTGQKVLREMPAIMSEAMEQMMPVMRKSIDHMNDEIQDQMAQMIRESATNPAPAVKN